MNLTMIAPVITQNLKMILRIMVVTQIAIHPVMRVMNQMMRLVRMKIIVYMLRRIQKLNVYQFMNF